MVSNGWVPVTLAPALRAMVGFRNVLVHGYQEVDTAILRDLMEHRLDDLLAFARAVRERAAVR